MLKSSLSICLLLSLVCTLEAQGPARPVLGPVDHVSSYWPVNFRPWPTWPAYRKVRYVNSGTYGLSFDVSVGAITRLGAWDNPGGGAKAALQLPNTMIDALPSLSVSHAVELAGVSHAATSFLGSAGSVDIPGRLVDGGRFMQRVDIPSVGYASEPSLQGSIELATMPRHFVLTHKVSSTSVQNAGTSAAIHLSGIALSALTQVTPLAGGRALRMTDSNGDGFVFLVPEVPGTTASVTWLPTGGITARRTVASLPIAQELAVSLLAVSTSGLSDAQLDVWLNPGSNVQVRYVQRDRLGNDTGPLVDAAFDPERGVYLVELQPNTSVGAPTYPNWADPNHQTWYNRHRLVVHSASGHALSVPIALDLEASVISSITGGCAMLRDENGEPLGVPVQISKNWHETSPPWRWYHFYATPLLPQGGDHDLEFTIARAKWGATFAVSHAQLSLIGWGRDQQWDESALGCWGESITYDPDLTLQRAMVDDVRPFLVQSQNLYNWTGNVGGADFLTYWLPSGARDRLGRLRTLYAEPGPNLTDVIYAGITSDGKIEARIRTRFGRTDDVVRAFYDLEYVFHDAVPYSRLAFFQVCADNYADNDFTRHAYGNAAGVLFDAASSPTGTVGYASAADRGIALPGDAPWVLLYDNAKIDPNLAEDVACVGFVVRDYEFVQNGVTTTTPHINIKHTNNANHPEVGFELGVPYDPMAPQVAAGSVLRATVEYLVLPDDKALYYGPSADLNALPASIFNTPEMMRRMADENRTQVSMAVGSLLRTHPIEIQCNTTDPVAAEFSLTGGFGYVPLVFSGLPSHDGWRLEQEVGGQWVDLGQEVEGNDYWQSVYDVASGTYTLTFNVDNTGTTSYRLVKLGPDATASPIATACVGPVGPISLTATQLPWVGSTFRSVATGFGTGIAVSLVGFGTPPAVPLAAIDPSALPGCDLLAAQGSVGLMFPVAGVAQYALGIPNLPALSGAPLSHQFLFLELDGQGQLVSLSSSNALELVTGYR